jgi:hypothetical protein
MRFAAEMRGEIIGDMPVRSWKLLAIMAILAAPATLAWAQNEPCLTGADDPACGIKVTFSPPLSDDKVLQVPSQIVVEVPARLKATKVTVTSGAAGSQSLQQIAEVVKPKKAGHATNFTLAIPSCSGIGSVLQVNIYSPKFPYPMVVGFQPITCK